MSEETPERVAQRLARPELPRRFYKKAAAAPHEGGFGLFLDGRLVKTPRRHSLVVSRAAVADALAAEWESQGERIDPSTMPLTRIVNAAIDHVGPAAAEVRAEIVKYAGSDLICYRAETPQELVRRQAEAWDPLVTWAREALGAPLMLSTGIAHVAQPEIATAAVARALVDYPPLKLAAISTVTALTGSAIIALALACGRLDAGSAWEAALIDEHWQADLWGRDALAERTRTFRRGELEAAGLILSAAQ